MNRYWVANTDEIPVGGRKIVTVKGIGFGIFNVNGEHLVDPNMKLRRGKLEENLCVNEHENLERGVLETEHNGIFLVI